MKTALTFHDFFSGKEAPAKVRKAAMKKIVRRANELQKATVEKVKAK